MAANNKSKGNLKKVSAYDPNYFRLPHPALGLFTLCLVMYMIVTLVAAHRLPDFLGPLSQFGKYMAASHYNVVIGFAYFTLIAHCLESAYAGKVCHDRRYSVPSTIKWSLSAFIFGFPSMIPLLRHKPRHKKA